MSATDEKRRLARGYAPNTPQCCLCAKYRKARMPTPTTIEQPWCVGGKFHVVANGCCDKWRDKKTGESLA